MHPLSTVPVTGSLQTEHPFSLHGRRETKLAERPTHYMLCITSDAWCWHCCVTQLATVQTEHGLGRLPVKHVQ